MTGKNIINLISVLTIWWCPCIELSLVLLGKGVCYAKQCSTYGTVALISHASKVMLKILQARLQEYVNWELPEVQVGFRKGRGSRDQSKRIPGKHQLCFSDYTKAFDCLDHNKLWEILKGRWIPDDFTCLLKTCMQVKKQQLELDIEQRTSSKLRKEYAEAVHCDTAYLTYMQSTSWEILGWMNHKLESRLPGEISTTSDIQMILPNGRKWRGTTQPLDKGKRGEWKSWFKTYYSKNEGQWHPVPSLHGK